MSPLTRLSLVLALAGLVQGCQLAGPGGSAGPDAGVTPNAVAGDPIEVTALDEAPAAAAPATAEAAATAAPQTAPPDAAAEEAGVAADPAPLPGTEAEAPAADAAAEAPPAEAAVEAPPPPPKPEAQLACEKKKGRWLPVGNGVLRACVFPTKDGGKQCDRESDCDGVCLARSGTCSPVKPLFGCNEILQDNGARVTLCIE